MSMIVCPSADTYGLGSPLGDVAGVASAVRLLHAAHSAWLARVISEHSCCLCTSWHAAAGAAHGRVSLCHGPRRMMTPDARDNRNTTDLELDAAAVAQRHRQLCNKSARHSPLNSDNRMSCWSTDLSGGKGKTGQAAASSGMD